MLSKKDLDSVVDFYPAVVENMETEAKLYPSVQRLMKKAKKKAAAAAAAAPPAQAAKPPALDGCRATSSPIPLSPMTPDTPSPRHQHLHQQPKTPLTPSQRRARRTTSRECFDMFRHANT